MGAEQSSNSESRRADTGTSQRTCYYELLEVERTATDIEIKKAYRKKALELHPDRNFNNVEAATEKFAEVQAAYDILSDPQERAWYDSHRESILSGQHDSNDASAPPTFHNVHLTTADDIMRLISRFNSTIPYTDDVNGFYSITRETFEHLAQEEEAAADYEGVECPEYPTFGSSDSDYDPTVKSFYAIWAGFATKKSFMWQDKYRLSDAPDRRTRRWMEKENKKLRDDAIREFTDAVRFLVSFVRKRDPRYIPNTQSEADRHKSLRTAAAAQAARSRAANKETYSSFDVPDWVHSREDENGQHQPSESEESEIETEILECVACNKRFKSEKQFESHERSKKHIKAVQDLRRQMKKETANLDLDATTVDVPEASLDEDQELRTARVNEQDYEANEKVVSAEPLHKDQHDAATGNGVSPNQNTPEADQSESHSEEEELDQSFDKLNIQSTSDNHDQGGQGNSSKQPKKVSADDTKPKIKIGKAKLKRQKKAAAAAATENEHRCNICTAEFDSKTKLFKHIRDLGHAASTVQPGGAGNGKKV
ncbi:meiotically up-regulated protein [Trichoderma guizhouense]|uniref:Meiotically up-regulated protein n=1 Tax=Trichoderma guizhouense TaxID=1491466 RepID=A0A1T3C9I1_9HYPO|nr:meiotically up-regulated protein [Trichoderma guizhouense]